MCDYYIGTSQESNHRLASGLIWQGTDAERGAGACQEEGRGCERCPDLANKTCNALIWHCFSAASLSGESPMQGKELERARKKAEAASGVVIWEVTHEVS